MNAKASAPAASPGLEGRYIASAKKHARRCLVEFLREHPELRTEPKPEEWSVEVRLVGGHGFYVTAGVDRR